MKRGDPIPKYLDSLVSIELFGELLSTIQLRFFIPAKIFGAPFFFPNLKLSIFHIDLRRPLLSVSGVPGSRAQLLCRLVCKFKDCCRTIFATNRTTIDSPDAYYFGNVDKISTPAARLRARISTAKIPQSIQNTFIFSGFHF
jgi:hypothetical protein